MSVLVNDSEAKGLYLQRGGELVTVTEGGGGGDGQVIKLQVYVGNRNNYGIELSAPGIFYIDDSGMYFSATGIWPNSSLSNSYNQVFVEKHDLFTFSSLTVYGQNSTNVSNKNAGCYVFDRLGTLVHDGIEVYEFSYGSSGPYIYKGHRMTVAASKEATP